MTDWLNRYWVACALVMGIFLFLMTPLLSLSWDRTLLLIFLQLPVYMIHQVEEHANDRFRLFVNNEVFGGREALNHAAILVINIPGVWGVNLVSLYAAALFGPGWGLSAIYLTLVNAVGHTGGMLVRRGYNPGLWTSLALFFPFGGLALYTVSHAANVTAVHHVVGLAVAVLSHVGIIVYAKARS